MRMSVTESVVEEAALDYFRELGYAILFGPDIALEEPGAERESFRDTLAPRLMSEEVGVMVSKVAQ